MNPFLIVQLCYTNKIHFSVRSFLRCAPAAPRISTKLQAEMHISVGHTSSVRLLLFRGLWKFENSVNPFFFCLLHPLTCIFNNHFLKSNRWSCSCIWVKKTCTKCLAFFNQLNLSYRRVKNSLYFIMYKERR